MVTLRELNPEAAKMWCYELNGDITPDTVGGKTDKMAYFRCLDNPKHIFQKRISKMTSHRDGHSVGCIFCGPNAKIPFPGETDLLSVVPEAQNMWDYSKNKINPIEVFPKSTKSAYFKCNKGHSVLRKICDFSRSTLCPECAKQSILLINNATYTNLFWDYKKNKDIDLNSLIQSAKQMVWFKCPECGYEWYCRTSFWNKIRYCKCCGFDGKAYQPVANDIITLKMALPESVNIWDFESNGDNTPDSLLKNSNYKAALICHKGHKYERIVCHMFKEDDSLKDCPYCNEKRRKVCDGESDFFTVCPSGREMWDFELNKDLDPTKLSPNSGVMAHFKCSKEHRFKMKIQQFFHRPYCRKCNLIDNHSIAVTRPDILKYWDYEKNTLAPEEVSPYSTGEAYWKCPHCGYSWKQIIRYRATATKGKCPSCDMKRNYIPSQQILTDTFRKYNAIAAELWVGEMNKGITPDNVSKKSGKSIHMRCINNPAHIYKIQICRIPQEEPYGCPYCRQRPIIFPDETDLFSICAIAKEMWDYSQNTGYELNAINPKSTEKVSWICSNGHHFKRSIIGFVSSSECPICKAEKLAVARFPYMVSQWNFKKNKGLDINLISSSSSKIAWWRCKKCGYEWQAQISSRKASKGLCPCCENRTVVVKGITDLFSVVPEIERIYDFEKNMHIDTEKLSVTSLEPVWWKCPDCNYSWQASPSGRLIHNNEHYIVRNCPACIGNVKTLSYADEFPDLAKKFLIELNGCFFEDVKSSQLSEFFWWYCDICGESFECSLYSMLRARTTSSKGCSYCSGKKVLQENSFAAIHPEVMDEYSSTNTIDAFSVTENSSKQAEWVCRNNPAHTWKASFYSRAKGQGGCNICRSYQYGKMFYEEHIEFKKYYDTAKNERPFESYANASNEAVWWKCDKGHSFQWRLYRFSQANHFKCPFCENKQLIIGENDLESQYPELALEFDSGKNKITPNQVLITNKDSDIWWQCSEGHEFQRSVWYRISYFNDCPICTRSIVAKGQNDFQTAYPKITDIWDYEKNERNPDTISDKNNKRYWFKCDLDHHYQTQLITVIDNEFECLICNGKIIQEGVNSLSDSNPELAQEFSPNEKRSPSEFHRTSAYYALWQCSVCKGDYYYQIRKRHYRDDSCPYCNDKRVLVGFNSLADIDELLAKEWSLNNIKKPTEFMKNSSYNALWNCPTCHGEYSYSIKDRAVGDDSCPYCNDRRVLAGLNSLADIDELLAKEWSPNNIKKPTEFMKNSSYNALWNCPTCHGEYSYSIKDRAVGDDSCPYCNDKRVLAGLNSLADVDELLAKEWSPNNIKKSTEFFRTSAYYALWNCPTCHGEYSYSIKNRAVGDDSCPYCNDRKVLPGYNSLKKRYPELLNEWCYPSNYLIINPDNILTSSNVEVWWQCKECNSKYKMSPKQRLYYQKRNMKSCPFCKGRRRKKYHYF